MVPEKIACGARTMMNALESVQSCFGIQAQKVVSSTQSRTQLPDADLGVSHSSLVRAEIKFVCACQEAISS